MKIAYLTSNAQKFEEATHILKGWDLERVDMELTEIQGTRQEIAHAKALEAVKQLGRPCIVEDVSVTCPALRGLPGPYIKDFLKTLGDDGLSDLVHRYDDHSAEVICTAAYVTPDSAPLLFEGIVSGTIVEPRGAMRHGKYSWNPIFIPDGHTHTMGEMSMEEHAEVSMRRLALDKLRHHLEATSEQGL